MNERERYGLIAGNGRFPFLILQSARQQNIDVVVAAIKEETFAEIESCGYPVHWLGLGQLGKLIKLFQKSGVRKAIMAGQVKHAQIFGSAFPDLTMIRMLAGLKQKNTDSLIGGIARILEESGIALVDSTTLLKPYLAPQGTLTRRGLNSSEKCDMDYGRPIARQLAALDIGQTIVVRDRAVLAVEAMEGTDAVIRRAGELGNQDRPDGHKSKQAGTGYALRYPCNRHPDAESYDRLRCNSSNHRCAAHIDIRQRRSCGSSG